MAVKFDPILGAMREKDEGQGEPGVPGAKGDPGEPGQKGEKGDGATVSVGSVTTGVPGSNATVTNVGTATDAILDFVIPRGNPGESGGGSSGGGFNTMEVIETSGTWTAKVTGWHKITCIGAGGAGGAAGAPIDSSLGIGTKAVGSGGAGGGFTAFGGNTAETALCDASGGSGGMGGGAYGQLAGGSGGGGGAGFVVSKYLYLVAGTEYPVFIGAGGVATTGGYNMQNSNTLGTMKQGCTVMRGEYGRYINPPYAVSPQKPAYSLQCGGCGGTGGGNGGDGASLNVGATQMHQCGNGGNGGINGTLWGNGGGGGTGCHYADYPGWPGKGGANASNGSGRNGGAGGNGAIIAEYYLAA